MMMTVTGCPNADQLRAFSLGELTDEQSDELFRHLQDCSSCKSELETVEDAEDSLIASLRSSNGILEFVDEPDCQVAVAKALGAFANAGETPTSSDLLRLPETFGEYEILRPLGRGGMGNVYLARHTKLGREVALKVLAGHRLADPRMQERFAAEMRAIGRLSHPNIVTAHDAREVDGTAVLVTEYIDGFDLGELVSRIGPLQTADACEIIRNVAVALQYTSQQGFVHRDVKPSNIMLSSTGEVKLLDLGLARLQYGQDDHVEITGTGQAMGTADYVAPEQVSDSRSVDVRADIYSLGCTLFKLLTGNAPFDNPQHATAFAKMTAHVSEQPTSLDGAVPNAPTRLVKLLDSMLAKAPQNRPQTPMAVAEKLTALTKGCDLQQLADLASKAPANSIAVSASKPSSTAPSTEPWYSCPVPMSMAIGAGFLGIVLGILMGIVITITYPDGTKVRITGPTGSDVEIENVPDGDSEPAALIPADAQAAMTIDPAAKVDPEYAPLAFIVLVEEGDVSDELIRAAKEELRIKGGDHLATEAGTWHRISGDDIRVPISASANGQTYALATAKRNDRVDWSDLQGHIVTVQKDRNLTLHFDDELAGRMSDVTGRNLNRQLGVIVDHHLVSAPFIISKLSSAAVISGNFSPQESMFLFQAIQGGLVQPMRRAVEPQSTPDRASINAKLQGIWRLVHLVDEQGTKIEMNDGILVFHQQRFFFMGEKLGFTALGSFTVTERSGSAIIRFDDVLGEQHLNRIAGHVRLVPDGRMMMMSMQGVGDGPTAKDVNMLLERLGEFPDSADKMHAMIVGERWKPSDVTPEPVLGIYQALQSDETSKDYFEQLARTLRNTRSQMDTRNNLKQIGLAFHNFYSSYDKLPTSVNHKEGALVKDGKKIHPFSWRVALLPYLEQDTLYHQYRFDQPWDSEENLKLLKKIPAVFQSPLAPKSQPVGHTNYQGFTSESSVLGFKNGAKFHDIIDGTSNTLLVIESAESVPWTKPQDLSEIPKFFEGQPIHLLFADAAVLQKKELDEATLKKLITCNGREIVQW